MPPTKKTVEPVEPEIKQGVVEVKKTVTHLKVAGMRGSYRSIIFDDNCISTEPVSGKDRSALAAQFPEATIEEIER